MTTTSYSFVTEVDRQTFGIAARVNSNNFFQAGAVGVTQIEAIYGSPIFPSPLPSVPAGVVVGEEILNGTGYHLYPDGTSSAPFASPSRIWIPNIQASYLQPFWRQASPQFPTEYYSSFNSFGSPQGSPTTFVGMEREARGVSIYVKRRYYTTAVSFSDPDKPNYISLLKGYELDPRLVPDKPVIIPSVSEQITLGYYRRNQLETIGFPSLDWMTYQVKLTANVPVVLPIEDCVLGTLHCSSQAVTSQVTALATLEGKYAYGDYFPSAIASLFNQWNALRQSLIIPVSIPPTATTYATLTELSRNVVTIGAINNYWNNRNNPTSDFNASPSHPLVVVDNQRAYDWHIKPQLDGSIGNLIMDSPRTIEIHAALNAGKWANNPDDANEPRQDDLGWRIQRMNEVLGIRVGTDLTFDPVKEKAMVRRVVNSSQKLDPKKVGVNNFGSDGMVVKRINNRFKGKEEIVSDQCVIIQDLLQLIQEYQEQHNLAVGIQESSAIEIKDGKNRARFDNQLGLLVEMFNLLTSANEMTRAALISSLVSQSQTNEIIAGLGLPSVTKTIPVSIDKKVTQLPYKGIAPHRSISQEVATCTANVGIVLGQLL